MKVILLFTIFAATAMASDDVKSLQKVAIDQAGKMSNTSELSNAVPGYDQIDQSKLDELKGLKDQGGNLADLAAEESEKNEAAKFAKESSKSRPEIELNRDTDPLFKNYNDIMATSHSLSESYSDCKELPVSQEQSRHDDVCFENAISQYEEFSCINRVAASCSNSNAGQIRAFSLSDFAGTSSYFKVGIAGGALSFGSFGNDRNGSCTWYSDQIKFNVDSLELVDFIRLVHVVWDDWAEISLNGHLVFKRGSGSCEQRRVFRENPNIDLRPYIIKGQNVITVKNLVSGGGGISLRLSFQQKVPCETKETWQRTCDNGRIPAIKVSQECIESGGIRQVGSFSFDLPCWAYKEKYKEEIKPLYSKDEHCQKLELQGCYATSKKCIQEDQFCRKKELSYTCTIGTAQNVSLCATDLACPDGKCTQEYLDNKPQDLEAFKKAATAMGVASALGSEIAKDQVRIFDGKAKRCLKKEVIRGIGVSLKKCCPQKNGGVLVDIGAYNCTLEEQELSQDVQAQREVSIGQYTEKKDLVKRYYRSYCTYPSKLARVIVQQGIKQLGRSFGATKNPECSGLTPDEISKLNFDQIDMTELFDDFYGKTTRDYPDIGNTSQRIQQNIEQKWKQSQDERSKLKRSL